MPRYLNAADGQLAATATAITAGGSDAGSWVTATMSNTGGSAETVALTVARNGGTQRQVWKGVLNAGESAIVANLPLDARDTLYGSASNAAAVDYVVSLVGEFPGPLAAQAFDANGALKSGAAAIGSGNLAVTGDLAVGGGDIDLGASGTAGSVDVFPSTASKGKLSLTAAANTGDTTTTIVNAEQATTRTYTIPDALASCNFLMGGQAAVARTATADGLTTGTIADAGRLQHVTVTSADANHIVILPTPTPGTIVVLHVGATGFELRSSTPASIAINGGSGADAESAVAAESTCVMVCVSATAWKGFFMDADGDLAKVEAAA